MWYLIIGLLLIFGIAFSSRMVCNLSQNKAQDSHTITDSLKNPKDTIKSMFSRDQINKKIKHLAETTPPSKLSYGAMCYSVACIKNMVHEYVCPVCGQKTIYKREDDGNKFQYLDMILYRELNSCRREVENVKGIHIKLDETEFCGHCKPGIKQPKLYLLINIEGETDTIKTDSFSYMDIRAVNEFLNDELIHKGSHDDESPLVHYLETIKRLFGVK